jgi:hypothetical protein
VTADPVLVLAWLVLAHLVADFVLQTESIALGKQGSGRQALLALLAHAAIVGACLLPLPVIFGTAGLAALVVVTVTHAVIDRTKVLLTRRVEAAALSAAHRAHEPAAPAASLGTAWTPVPAFLFVVDQAAHIAVLVAAWAMWLAPTVPSTAFADAVAGVLAGRDPAAFHRLTVAAVVIASLVIVNVRAAALLVGTLVHPRQMITGTDPVAAPVRPTATGYTVRVGRWEGRVDPDPPAAPPPAPTSPARVGLVIGVIERLLIVTLVLAHAEAAIGLVVAAKTLARFKQLDDRSFAEYYLLGTLASVGIALGSAIAAGAALASLA